MAGTLRALSFTRDGADVGVQRTVFTAACAARGWQAGGSVRQMGGGLAGWAAVVRLVRSGAYGVVVVDTVDRLAVNEVGRMAVLAMPRCPAPGRLGRCRHRGCGRRWAGGLAARGGSAGADRRVS